MLQQLPGECLYEIFNYLGEEDDDDTLRSCILVNRLLCKAAVRVLWRNSMAYTTANITTLIACLPAESKNILLDNGIVVSNSIENILVFKYSSFKAILEIRSHNPPMFNYASFCTKISVTFIDDKIERRLRNSKHNNISSENLKDYTCILAREIYKLFINQIPFLDKLAFPNTTFLTINPGSKDWLRDLSHLICSSNHPDFFLQLSKTCHNLSSLYINVEKIISDELVEFIAVQRNLKTLSIKLDDDSNDLFPFLMKIPEIPTLTKLGLHHGVPFFFIKKFVNLQELKFSYQRNCRDLQYVKYLQLNTLKIYSIKKQCSMFLPIFLEINGLNLREIHFGDGVGNIDHTDHDNTLNLAVAKFCPNLRKFTAGFTEDEIETLKLVFNNCQNLESLKISCGGGFFLEEERILEIVVEYAPRDFHELIINFVSYFQFELSCGDFESLLIRWGNRRPQVPLSLFIIDPDDETEEFVYEELVDEYVELGVLEEVGILDAVVTTDNYYKYYEAF